MVRHSRTVRTYSYFSAFACISYVHTHTGTECAVYMYTLHMCWHTPAHNIQRTHTHYLEVWPRPLATQLAGCRSECVRPALSPSAALLQDGCLLAALHHRAPTNGNLNGCATLVLYGERDERESEREKKREMRGDMSEGGREREKEREEVCEGKCTAPPLLQNHD